MGDLETRLMNSCRTFVEQQLFKDKLRFVVYFFSPSLLNQRKRFKKKAYNDCSELTEIALKIENSKGYLIKDKLRSIVDDFLFCKKYGRFPQFKPVSAEVVIVVIGRNEGCYLDEWITYYKMIGVDHIYYLDNNSTDNTKEVLKKYIESGFVTYMFLNGEKAQLPGYRYVTRKIKKCTKWIAFLDADEFLYTKEEPLKEFLSHYEKYPGIAVNWVVYGPCGHETRPDGFVIENYTSTFSDRDNVLNLRVKTIAQPKKIWDIKSPHYAIYNKNQLAVDENMKPVDGSKMLVPGAGRANTEHNSIEKIRINHYWTKSLEELRQKCDRGYAAGNFEPQYNSILARLDYPLMEDSELAERCRNMFEEHDKRV